MVFQDSSNSRMEFGGVDINIPEAEEGDTFIYDSEAIGAPSGDPNAKFDVNGEYTIVKKQGDKLFVRDRENVVVEVDPYHFRLKKKAA